MFEYNKKSIGSRIRKIRKDAGMTLREFSQLLDVPVSSISSWEGGVNIPSTQNLQLLSEKTNVKPSWILYGEITDYLQDVFDYYELNEVVNEEKFFELEKELIEMRYQPGDFKVLADTALLIIPNFEELIHYEKEEDLLSTHMLNNEFPILQQSVFQKNYLPTLQSLLLGDNKDENDVNNDIILYILDLLSRMNENTKPVMKQVIRDLNWLLSNNVFRLEKEYQSKKPNFGGIESAEAYKKQRDREYREIKEEADQIIRDISTRLKDIVELNYEEYEKKEYKSFF
ncbi:helix-turn-helix domain-containing protein [Bacillus aquiflavi]|uniref:helix-turn-helix domain-containing protein n=1 Tax=Bacillus aquiflavi TaxID=2672567 RepID=UPI001CA9DC11|nr:helix-turn-helix transcriptional regulator [Bacillus aquiflavi]UAC48315.1 helix-turn-helix domain-containing protein [Bacillus aquiflavi]